MKSDPFGEKPRTKRSEKRSERPLKRSTDTMDDKLAQLRNKFK
jgi:hypothetical protein